jgi:DNA polymerase IV
VARLRRKSLVAACVTVKIRRGDFTTFTRQRRFEPATNDGRTISAIAATLLREWLREQPRAALRLLGVGVSHFAPAEQLDLFDGAQPPEATKLDAELDGIRERFGTQAVKRGSTLRGAEDD